MSTNRRNFLSLALAGTAAASLSGWKSDVPRAKIKAATRSVMDLKLSPFDQVRFGFVGVGNRGHSLLRLMLNIEGASVVALADPDEKVLLRAAGIVAKSTGKKPYLYGKGEQDYQNMVARDDIDAVIIATPWRLHTPMALKAMSQGKQTFIEVPAAVTVEQCWQLVEASETYQVNCMMLENVCYGRSELMVLNMVRKGLFGELLHGEAAYIHELRWQMHEVERGTGSWRTKWHTTTNGNLYPTHGLGPVSQYMGINRGDRFDYLNSMSSQALGRKLYARNRLKEDNPHKHMTYICGDMNTSLIRTIKGRTIMVQHDTTTPRPYTRHNLIQGTSGVFSGFPDRIALENNPFQPDKKDSFHRWSSLDKKWQGKYDHPLWRQLNEEARRQGGHGGMDFIMLWRLVYCLRNGLALDQNVYDAAAWSVVAPLSSQSVADRGKPMDIPDFTRGYWKKFNPLNLEFAT